MLVSCLFIVCDDAIDITVAHLPDIYPACCLLFVWWFCVLSRQLFTRALDAENVGADGVVMVHPTCGPTQADDIPGDVR